MIEIRKLEKVFSSDKGLVRAVKQLDLSIEEGEFVVLLGPSGCGKTTTLRCVAGLERPDSGSIEVAGKVVDSAEAGTYVSPERRNMGMVFQSYAVWPHLSVYKNVALPLTEGRHRIPARQVRERTLEALRLVRLEELESRPVTDLSGGQQQRVALARAVVTHPKVLLMDEPLSNLDARLRDQMRFELKNITRSVGVTTLYVTHDQAEALSLGDRICVMKEGSILQDAPPQEVYTRPANRFIAEFVGEMNFIPSHIVCPGQAESPFGPLRYLTSTPSEQGKEITIAVRPEHLSFSHQIHENCAGAHGKIVGINYVGDSTFFEVEVNGCTLRVKEPGIPKLRIGDHTKVVLSPNSWHIYDN